MELPDRVCIIGAGSSGIAACKVLHEHQIPFDCFEASDRVGGNWVYENRNQMSSAYKSLFINTSKPRMQYSDYPMPADYPVFPHHSQIAEYFDDYVNHFDVKQYIRFNTLVKQAEPLNGGGWEITLADGETHRYRALLVANGHHWDPRWPDPPYEGEFQGDIIHSHYYKIPAPYQDKRVLIVGFGNSAMDISVETSRISTMTYLSVRHGFHIIPKYLLGRPLDQINTPGFLPFALQRKLYELVLRLQTGKMTNYGLPEPDHKLLHAHPTINSEILNRLAHGRIQPKPDIRRLDGDGVLFVDGSREQIDSIIYCTGYKVTFPFFRAEVIEARQNTLQLFKRVYHPDYPDLFFLGLLQPLGAIMPLAELQSHWISRYLRGAYALPEPREMRKNIQQEHSRLHKRYGNAPRHTMQVDVDQYVTDIKKEMQKGAQRPHKTPLIQPDKASQPGQIPARGH